MESALKYKVKQSKNGRFPSNYKASLINFEMQISLCMLAPPNISPSKNKPPQKRAFEKYKPRGLFSEFYGISKSKKITAIIIYSAESFAGISDTHGKRRSFQKHARANNIF